MNPLQHVLSVKKIIQRLKMFLVLQKALSTIPAFLQAGYLLFCTNAKSLLNVSKSILKKYKCLGFH